VAREGYDGIVIVWVIEADRIIGRTRQASVPAVAIVAEPRLLPGAKLMFSTLSSIAPGKAKPAGAAGGGYRG
jgi:hypothetical protein